MIRCSIFAAGRPICESWRWKQCKRCPRFPGHIHLSNGSSRPSAGSIWIVCSFGLQMTWNESWSCSKTTTTQFACTKGDRKPRRERRRGPKSQRRRALKITFGKAILTGCLNCQSPLEWQFAMHRRLVKTARARWRVEMDYRELKEELGLDHYEGRHWLSWHHHVTLVSMAFAFLRTEQAQAKKLLVRR